MRIGILIGFATMALGMSAARADDVQTFGPGTVWCASQTTCHLRISPREDYGFNALSLSPTMQQALLGPCQMREDCTAEISGIPVGETHLLKEVRAMKWLKAPPGFRFR